MKIVDDYTGLINVILANHQLEFEKIRRHGIEYFAQEHVQKL